MTFIEEMLEFVDGYFFVRGYVPPALADTWAQEYSTCPN